MNTQLTVPEFRLVPEPVDERAANLAPFKWAEPHIGTRHKLGGNPEYLQNAETPKCPECGNSMAFYSQLDSLNDEFCIADCGMIYVHVCFECVTVHASIQSS